MKIEIKYRDNHVVEVEADSFVKAVEAHKANLTRADLTRANLFGADMTDANMTGANMTDANLAGVNLTWANTKGAVGLKSQT